MEGGAGVMLSGNLKMWGFLRWKPRVFEMDGEEIRLCTPLAPPSPAQLLPAASRAARSGPAPAPLRSPLSPLC